MKLKRVTKILNVLRNKGSKVQKFGTIYIRISQNFIRHIMTLQEGNKMGSVPLIYCTMKIFFKENLITSRGMLCSTKHSLENYHLQSNLLFPWFNKMEYRKVKWLTEATQKIPKRARAGPKEAWWLQQDALPPMSFYLLISMLFLSSPTPIKKGKKYYIHHSDSSEWQQRNHSQTLSTKTD